MGLDEWELGDKHRGESWTEEASDLPRVRHKYLQYLRKDCAG